MRALDPMVGTDASPSDGELIREARAGDERASSALVRRYLRKAMAAAMSIVGNRDDAEDVVQEAFRLAFEHLDRFDPERPFAPWLFAIVRNVGRNAIDSAWHRRAVPLVVEHESRSASPHALAERAALRTAIDGALATLPDMQRRCFTLCAIEGFTNAEAASATGLAESTVRVHVFRARERLQPLLRDWHGGTPA